MMFFNGLGLLLIAGIVWWFWLYKSPEVQASDGVISIVVENGSYSPSRIKLKSGQPVTLRFQRKDASPCSSTVMFSDLEISADLPLNKATDIELPALNTGKYPFSCQMQMYRGEIIVEV